jgi:hypothetical protein
MHSRGTRIFLVVLAAATWIGHGRAATRHDATRDPRAVPPHASGTVRFDGLVNEPIGGASLVRQGSALRVSNLAGSGTGGVRIRLPRGATQVRVRAEVPNESKLPAGAYLEISSLPTGSVHPLGFLRITRSSGEGGYEVTGSISNTTHTLLGIYHGGREVRRDLLGASGNPFARVPACLACGSSLNDALGRASSRSEANLSGVVLRWQWSEPRTITIMNRPGRRDTTVVADELRLLQDDRRSQARTLSELVVRGRRLGEIRIRSERLGKSERSSRP